MTKPNLESRLKQAAMIAAPLRSSVEDVMGRLPSVPPKPRHRWRSPLYGAVAALAGIAAVLAFVFMLAGPTARFTLADVQAALESQHWVHARFDAGQTKEEWFNLQTGEFFAVQFTGRLVYINEQQNTRLSYWKESGALTEDTPILYAPGQSPPKWKPGSAWDAIVGSYEKAAKRSVSGAPVVEIHDDTLNGIAAIRFDNYNTDSLGKRFLYTQLWADPHTRLPIRIKTYLQLGQREEDKKDWSTGDYDFPATGPADIFALGVPAGTPIHKELATAPADVQPILNAINHAHDNFLQHYRAVVVTTSNSFPETENLSIIWHDGDQFREDYHLPGVEMQGHPTPPFPKELLPDQLVAWSDAHFPVVTQMTTQTKGYFRTHYADDKEPQVQIYGRESAYRALFSRNFWPEFIQWPTVNQGQDFQRLPTNPDVPECTGIRRGNGGNTREDFYVDPKNDYVCVLNIRWTKRDDQWIKAEQVTLSDLHRVADHVVAGARESRSYPTMGRAVSGETIRKTTINLIPLKPSDYPATLFDPTTLLTGATVVGF